MVEGFERWDCGRARAESEIWAVNDMFVFVWGMEVWSDGVINGWEEIWR